MPDIEYVESIVLPYDKTMQEIFVFVEIHYLIFTIQAMWLQATAFYYSKQTQKKYRLNWYSVLTAMRLLKLAHCDSWIQLFFSGASASLLQTVMIAKYPKEPASKRGMRFIQAQCLEKISYRRGIVLTFETLMYIGLLAVDDGMEMTADKIRIGLERFCTLNRNP